MTTFLSNEITKSPGDSKGPLIFELTSQPKTTIHLQVTSKYGCISENKSLTLQRIPKFSMQVKDSAGCIPFEVYMNALTGDPVDQVNYHWNFGDGKTGDGSQISHTYLLPDQKHDVTLFAGSATTGCKDTLFYPGLITVFPEPVATFSTNGQILSNENPVALFSNQSTGADQFLWQFGDGMSSHTKDPTHRYEVVGPRRALLESVNKFGCVDTISKEILIGLGNIFAPNAINPNSSNPVDRTFLPFCNGVNEKGYHLKIVSRWNDVVYECKDEWMGWKGRLSDGSLAPAGNYIWLLKFVDFQGKIHSQNGTVTLIY